MRLAALALIVGLGTVGMTACGSSDADGSPTVPTVAPTTQPAATTVPVATSPVTTEAPAVTAGAVSSTAPTATDAPVPAATEPESSEISVTDADVADLEKQLDDIDQLLAGVDSDLSHD
jgi:hypothetical protein